MGTGCTRHPHAHEGVRDRQCGHLRNGRDDASAGIQAAINACPVGQVVQLSAGLFTVNNHVRIGKGITLRGAAPRVTTLRKTNQGSEQEQILIVGPSRWPHIDEATAVNLTADAVQGAMSVTVQNSAGFAPGQFVKLDEDDYTTATWMTLPPRIAGGSPQILATDRLVWPIRNPARRAICRCPRACPGTVAQDGHSPRSRK